MTPTIRLAAVGDLLLTTAPWARQPGRGCEAYSQEILDLFKSCHLVLANLECTLSVGPCVETEPRVVTTSHQLSSLPKAHICVVSLANNHTFDHFQNGYHHTARALSDLKIAHFGAGGDIQEALRPALFSVDGIRLAFLGAVSASTGMKAMAGPRHPGVAPLDVDMLCAHIRRLKKEVDHVVLSLHWGEERVRIPSPEQIRQARCLIDAGASVILGHHPHVPQGMELAAGGAVFYSLGNSIANPVYYANGDRITWNRLERTGIMALMEFGPDGVVSVKQLPTLDDGERVRIDRSPWARRTFLGLNARLRGGVSDGAYRREVFRVQVLRPFLDHLLSVHRPETFKKAARKFRRLARGL